MHNFFIKSVAVDLIKKLCIKLENKITHSNQFWCYQTTSPPWSWGWS